MGKITDVNETRKQLYKNFQDTRGAMMAFCREKGITDEWMRLVFKGEYEDLDLLIEAADFLKRYKEGKETERNRKSKILQGKVSALEIA